MKRTLFIVFAAAMAVASFVGCATTQATAVNTTPAKSESNFKRETVDWTGASVGQPIPDWLVAASAENEEDLLLCDNLGEKLAGKYWIVCKQKKDTKTLDTKTLKMAEEAADANYMTSIARTLNAAVVSAYSGVLSANEDSQKTLTSAASAARFTGFKRVKNGYVLTSFLDKKTNKETLTYEVIRIYACDEDLWEQQASKYIESLGLNSESADMQKASAETDKLVKSIKSGFAPETED